MNIETFFQSYVNDHPISDPIVAWCIDNSDPKGYTCKRVLHNSCAEFDWTRVSNADSSRCKSAVSGSSFACIKNKKIKGDVRPSCTSEDQTENIS